ncbi:FtsK/SpoIIIE domain-containing protein [Microcoleus sp. herbarium19]|uniref:FtsK/SpoIIIE domain-containing protein n=2 Tax=unclassified Microcoleus TaxID=2642155 RepID=UPI002FCECBDB
MARINNQSYLLSLEIAPKRTIHDNSRPTELRKNIQKTQQQLITSISNLGTNLTISLRYIYDPNQSPKLKTYLLIDHPHNTQTAEDSEQILSLLTKGKLSQFFTLTPQPNLTPFQNLDWVQTIGEILKHEEFIAPQNYYLPHLFEANQTNDMSAVCDVIHRLDSKLILEITLQTYHNPTQKSLWVNAINQMLAQLEKVNANTSGIKDNILSVTSALYQKYQQSYPNSDLFQYSIKALAENRADAFPVLDTLINHAIKETPHGKRCRIIQISKNQPGFSESLEATKNVNISSAIEWEGWHKNNSEMSIANAIQPQKKGLGKFGGDSGSLSDKPSFYPQNQPPMIGGVNSEQNPNLPQLYNAVSDGSGLAKLSSTPPPSRMVDLKPLHRLATAQEISGFFRIAVSRSASDVSIEEEPNKLPEKLTIEDVVRKYRQLITEDTYIVGIDQKGKPCISDFSKIPHRIVAGVPGSGKTNFITSVIYQFLYANPERKIYIADFQAGMHYQLIVDQQPSLEMVTELEQCATLLNQLWKEHETRRELMRDKRVRSLTDLKQKHNIKKHRIVLIIDEAFYIQNAERKTRESIEKNLMGLAAQARVTGIHIIYCSQRPTPEVIPSQISDNMDERLIFRVQPAASQRLLDDDRAASLPVEPRGRAVYRGSEPELTIVATPFVPDEIWEN